LPPYCRLLEDDGPAYLDGQAHPRGNRMTTASDGWMDSSQAPALDYRAMPRCTLCGCPTPPARITLLWGLTERLALGAAVYALGRHPHSPHPPAWLGLLSADRFLRDPLYPRSPFTRLSARGERIRLSSESAEFHALRGRSMAVAGSPNERRVAVLTKDLRIRRLPNV
jgi:hypothetical protein